MAMISSPTPNRAEDWDRQWNLLEKTSPVGGGGSLAHPRNRFLRPLVRPSLRVLEAGCGDGRYLLSIAAEGAVAVGLDFSPLAGFRARKAVDSVRASNAFVTLGDIFSIPFASASFDLYCSFGVFEHFKRPQHPLLFAEACRVLRPGGHLYVEVPHLWSLWSPRRALRYWYRSHRPPALVWQKNLSRAYVVSVAEQAGFRTVESHVLDAWGGFRAGLSLGERKLKGVPNPFSYAAPLFRVISDALERHEWLGASVVYVGRRPD